MALISELLAAGPTYSFEFFPPKTDAEQATLVRALVDLQPLNPSFVSVTYRGGLASRRRTTELVAGMVKTTGFTPMAHLICASHTRLDLAETLVEMRKAGVENILALGGDPPVHEDSFQGELLYAEELVHLARAIGGFSIGVAAHPIGHPRSSNLVSDRHHLASKMHAADFAMSQFFFEADDYFRLVNEMHDIGVNKPIVPGIMPVTAHSSIDRMASMGAAVPGWMVHRLTKYSNPDDIYREGVDMATELCQKLMAQGAPGLHFYTLNKSHATREMYRSLGLASAE